MLRHLKIDEWPQHALELGSSEQDEVQVRTQVRVQSAG